MPGQPNKSTWTASRIFALKIAFFYTLMICLVFGVDTYVNALEQMHGLTENKCSLGQWILLISIPLLIGNYFLLTQLKGWHFRCFVPFTFTVILGWSISAYAFTPFLNCYQLLALALFPVPALIASCIRYIQINKKFLTINALPLVAKIEWIKESTSTWRTLALSGATIFLAFIAFWLNYMYIARTEIFKNIPQKQAQAQAIGYTQAWISIQGTCIILTVLLGPCYECFLKAQKTKDLLLEIEEKSSTPLK